MTTYSFVQYDVLTGGMYFKGTPIPDLDLTISEGSISSLNTKEYLQSIQTEAQLPVSQSASQAILDYLDTIPEIDLNNSKTVILTIEIIDDIESGNVDIVSKNLDGTKTYTLKSSSFSEAVVDLLKPKPIKWKTFSKNCPNCLKLTFSGTGSAIGSEFNFSGDIGGQYAGTFINNQKSFTTYIPDYSNAATYGIGEQYTIFWKPNITYTGTDYNGDPIVINNQHKWIATPTSYLGTVNEIGPKTFFHVSSMFTASCPSFNPNPGIRNFRGVQGFFILDSWTIPPGYPEVPCTQFVPNPGNVDWGYNCNPLGGCVSALSGSLGQYATYNECVESGNCTPPTSSNYGFICNGPNNCITGSVENPGPYDTFLECLQGCPPSYGFDCINGACVEGTEGATGSFATFVDCENSGCGQIELVTCSCDPTTNLVQNPNFANGSTNWEYYPTTYIPTVGNVNFSNGYIQANPVGDLSTSLTSSLFVSQSNVFQVSCSYEICFNVWKDGDNPTAVVGVNGAFATNDITNTPTAAGFTFVADTTDLIFYFGVGNGGSSRIGVDDICVTLLSCPPEPSVDCTIVSGSASTYETGSFGIPCLCPSGYTDDGLGNCVASGSILVNKIITGIQYPTVPETSGYWGKNRAVLYYNYNTNGLCPTSLPSLGGTQSPLQGNSNVWNTQYTFDILKNPMWVGSQLSFIEDGLMNQYSIEIPLNGQWMGGGSFLEVSSSKTYYAAIAGDDLYRLKLDGTTIIEISPTSVQYGNSSFNSMHAQSRQHPLNPYLTTSTPSNIPAGPGVNWSYKCIHIYPISMSAGCHTLSLEGKDTDQIVSGLFGMIFDNTATEIASATNISQLNVIWNAFDDIIYDFANTPITASCPTGSTPIGPEPCDQCLTSGSAIPCGDCLDCFNGIIYNGYVVDKGGASFKGRGPEGIVNIDSNDNPINTWVVPDETDWNTLVTYLNGGVTPITVTQTGSLGTTVGGRLKEYTRDSNATCWEFPNAGSTTSTNNSGWTGTAAGKRDEYGNFSGLGFNGYWWSANSLSTPPVTNGALMATRELKHYSSDVFRDIYAKSEGHSIRLVRPAATNEANGATIFDAYVGNDGKLYDGIVIGTQVWIDKNLNETQYNNGTNITLTPNTQTWVASLNTGTDTSCYYSNTSANTSSLEGNINPATGECYQFPPLYVYQNCNTSELLVQTVSGSTTTPGKVQKSSDGACWSFVEATNINDNNYIASIYSTTNYFTGSNYVYDNCDECEAIHTIYMTFGTKNC
jgi:uncharacterized protein (TIGR02145 family)